MKVYRFVLMLPLYLDGRCWHSSAKSPAQKCGIHLQSEQLFHLCSARVLWEHSYFHNMVLKIKHISKFGPAQRIGIWHFSLLVVKFTRQHECKMVIITQLDFCLILRLTVNLIILTSQGGKWLTLDK